MSTVFWENCGLGAVIALAVVLLLTAAGTPVLAEETGEEARVGIEPVAQEEVSAVDSLPTFWFGQVVYLDPATGRITTPDAARRAEARGPAAAMMSRSSTGLFETASPRSGVMVNLLGRFRNGTTATLDENGALEVECSSPPVQPIVDQAIVDQGGER